MPVRVKKKPVATLPQKQQGFWALRLSPFIDRYALALGVCLVAVASIRIVSSYSALSPTYDEPVHFACGLEYLSRHLYQSESQHPPLSRAAMALLRDRSRAFAGGEHPPLSRAAMALLPYLDGARLTGDPNSSTEGRKIIVAARDPGRMIFLMRLGILPFFWMACLFLYLWGCRNFGKVAAVMATGLFTLLPPVLAHAGLATTDMALTAGMISAFFSLQLWAVSPNWRSGLLLGLTTAIAALSKYSAVGFLPLAAALSLIFYLIAKRPGLRLSFALSKARLATFLLAVVCGAIAIWAGYWFSFGPVPGWQITLPAPELFDGINHAVSHNAQGHPAYLLGETSMKGWWYFFPVALAVKTPAAFLLLVLTGVLQWFWKGRANLTYLAVLAFCIGILGPAMASHVNIGVRHILPIYAGLSILAAIGLASIARRSSILAGGLVAWIAVSGAIQHPDYLAYFNEFAGGSPGDILVDSDLDWCQNMKMLSHYLRAVDAKSVAHNIEPINLTSELYPLPPAIPLNVYAPAPGWNVVSLTVARHTRYDALLTGTDYEALAKSTRNRKPWYEQMEPTKRLGGLLLYYIPPSAPQR